MGNKKSRRTGGLKTTRAQLKKKKRLQHFANTATLAHRRPIEGWDDTLTLEQNYKMLGLATDANKVVANPRSAAANPENQFIPAKANGLLSSKLDAIQALPKKAAYQAKSMSIQEQYRLQDLVRKHGDDYESMQRDLKLNIYQDTARQLEKRVKLMLSLQAAGEEEEEEEAEEEEMVDESVLADLAKDKKFQEIFADLDSDEEAALLASMGDLEAEFGDDEDEEVEEVAQKVIKTAKKVAKKAKKAKQPKVEIGDNGAKLVKPKLSQGTRRKPVVLTREE